MSLIGFPEKIIEFDGSVLDGIFFPWNTKLNLSSATELDSMENDAIKHKVEI